MARAAVGSRLWTPVPLGTPLPAARVRKLWTPRQGAVRFSEERAVRMRRWFEGSDATIDRRGSGLRAPIPPAVVHTKGRFEGHPFYLDPWQWREIVAPLFGHEMLDPELEEWVRLYTLAWVTMGRKNGKSELMAAIGLYGLTAEDEASGEVYSVAKDREQASLVFNVGVRMAELSPIFRAAERGSRLRIVRNTRRIFDTQTGSVWRVLAADAEANLGADPFMVLFDEIVSQPSNELWDALKTAFGSRSEPLMLAATTAGRRTKSFAKEEDDRSLAVLADPSREPRRFVFSRRAPSSLDWKDPRAVKLANPALGSFLRRAVIDQEIKEIEPEPGVIDAKKLETFEIWRLNRWNRGTGSGWIPLELWDRGAGGRRLLSELEDELAGRRCYAAADLSSSQDFSALAYVFPLGEPVELEELDEETGENRKLELERHAVVWRHWIPEAAFYDLNKRTGGEANGWQRAGLLEVTPGNVIDYQTIAETLERDGETFEIAELAYDRWGAIGFVSWLKDELEGLRVIPFGQGFRDMGPATLDIRRLATAGGLVHGGHPLARWQAGNVRVDRDPAGNEKFNKDKALDKIDGIVAATMGVRRAMLHAGRTDRRGGQLVTFGG